MNTETLCSLVLEDPEGLKELISSHSILGIAGVIHNAVTHLENSARIISAGNGLRNPADGFFKEINVSEIIQIKEALDNKLRTAEAVKTLSGEV